MPGPATDDRCASPAAHPDRAGDAAGVVAHAAGRGCTLTARLRRVVASPATAGLLLLAYWWLAVSATREKSVTVDEVAHLTAGTSYWLTGDLRLQPENGQLPQRLAGLVPLAQGARFPDLTGRPWEQADVWTLGVRFLADPANPRDRLLLAARAAMAGLTVLLGALVWWTARRLFGPGPALLSLLLFALDPTLLSHGALVTSDAAAALFFLAATLALRAVLDRLTISRLVASALALTGLALAKMSAPLFLPLALALAAVRLWRGRPWPNQLGRRHGRIVGRRAQAWALAGVLLVDGAVAWAGIWLAYGCRYSAFRDPAAAATARLPDGGWPAVLTPATPVTAAVTWARDHRVLPEAYLFGLMHTVHHSRQRDAFLCGAVGNRGWWWFFPYCWLVKTPPSLFLALGLAAAVAWQRAAGRGRRAGWRRARLVAGLYRTAPLWVLLAVYAAAAVSSHLNIGQRHLLPLYPPLFVLAGAAARRAAGHRRWQAALLAALLAWQAAESWRIRPHYLAYFNLLAGGPSQGYRHLVDSSLDWGQDLPGLSRWLRENRAAAGPDAPVYLAYFGMAAARSYGVDATRLPPFLRGGAERGDRIQPPLEPLRPGIYCVSATALQCVYWPEPRRWSAAAEDRYRLASRRLDEYRVLGANAAAEAEWIRRHGKESWRELVSTYPYLMQTRLCTYLRRREPDAQVGYSILIYVVNAADLRQALQEPLPEGTR